MNLDQLEVLVAVIEEGGLRAAAKRLHRTQPTLSMAIKNLEDSLGFTILDRSGYRVRLSDAGQVFFPRALALVAEAERLRGFAAQLAGTKEPVVRVAIDYLAPLPMVLELLRHFQMRCEGTQIEVDFEVLSGAQTKLASGDVQIAISPFFDQHSDLVMQAVCDVELIPWIAAAAQPDPRADLAALLKVLPQIVVRDSNQSAGASLGVQQIGPKWVVSDHMIKRELILGGLGWGYLEATSVVKEFANNSIRAIELEAIPKRVLALQVARRGTDTLGPVGRDLWDYVVQHGGEDLPPS